MNVGESLGEGVEKRVLLEAAQAIIDHPDRMIVIKGTLIERTNGGYTLTCNGRPVYLGETQEKIAEGLLRFRDRFIPHPPEQ